MALKRILLLNSYTLTSRRPEQHVRVRSFLEGLEQGGYRRGHEVDVEIVDSNSIAFLENATRKATERPLDLIHAVGTPNAIVAAHSGGGVPVVYYGAHPEGAGERACREAGVVGMQLTLPFTQSYKHFRFIRRLLPKLKRVWVPFYEDTVFCQPEMKAKHRHHRSDNSGSVWLEGTSPLTGYRGLAGLCYVIDVEYREFVYRSADDLAAGLEQIDRRDAVLMPYNDSVYCEGAPMALARYSLASGVPLFWNNNTEATRIGALGAVSGCFREAGLATGKMAAAILDGAAPQSLPLLRSKDTYSSLNSARARELGLEIAPEVVAEFKEVI